MEDPSDAASLDRLRLVDGVDELVYASGLRSVLLDLDVGVCPSDLTVRLAEHLWTSSQYGELVDLGLDLVF